MTIATRFGSCIAALLMMTAAPVAAQPVRDINIGLASTSLAVAPARLAQEMGFFQKQGLNAKFTFLDGSNATTTALIARSFDVVVSGPGEIIAAQARGQKVVAIANMYSGFGAVVVLSKEAAEKMKVPVTASAAERLKALDGVLIASAAPTSAYSVALKASVEAQKSNVRFTFMNQNVMPVTIESGAVQGFVAGAPFWAYPVVKGTGLVWLNGPKGDFPSQFVSASSANLQTMRDFADANPELMKKLAAVFADFTKAFEERPADVRAALAKLYPDVDTKTMDLIFTSELSLAWKTKPLTPADMAHEIAFMKLSGVPLPQIDSIDPATLIVK